MTGGAYILNHSERDTMRDLTDAERETFYAEERCPFCRAPTEHFRRGPRGGIMRNVECPYCECRVNAVDDSRYYGRVFFGQVIREPRLGFVRWIDHGPPLD